MLTIVILYETIKQNTRHGYGTTREKRIIVHAISNFDTGWGVHITG
jgi:hypothetical protein